MRALRRPAELLRFGGSSLACAALDAGLLLPLNAVSGNLLLSVVGARLVSGAANFWINRRVVFAAGGDARRSALRYGTVAGGVLAANAALMELLVTAWAWPLLAAKALVETTLFLTSYAVQRRVVFGPGGRAARRGGDIADRPPQDATPSSRLTCSGLSTWSRTT